jgi:hypothetical protein
MRPGGMECNRVMSNGRRAMGNGQWRARVCYVLPRATNRAARNVGLGGGVKAWKQLPQWGRRGEKGEPQSQRRGYSPLDFQSQVIKGSQPDDDLTVTEDGWGERGGRSKETCQREGGGAEFCARLGPLMSGPGQFHETPSRGG